MYAPECRYHKNRPATTQCAACGAPVCHDCAQPTPSGQPLCRACCARHGLPQKRGGAVTTLAIVSIGLACAYALGLLAMHLGDSPIRPPILMLGYCLPAMIFNVFLLLRHKWAYWACIGHSILMLLLFVALVGLAVYAVIDITSHDTGHTSDPGGIVVFWFLLLFLAAFAIVVLFFLIPPILVLPIIFLCILTRPAVRLEFGYLPKEKRVTV